MALNPQIITEAVICWFLGGLLFSFSLGISATLINSTTIEHNEYGVILIQILFDSPAIYLVIVGLRLMHKASDEGGGNY
jgi:hypothetical protein